MKRWFGPEGMLSGNFRGFEFREAQLELAEMVWQCLNSGERKTLLAEAPTGIGKTLALLVPGALWAASSSKRILYLTSTITLQEHLFRHHLPQVEEITGSRLSFGMLKGRRHYACLLKARELIRRGPLEEAGQGWRTLSKEWLSDWLGKTATGELSELGIHPESGLAAKLSASRDSCIGASCPQRNGCFLYRMYRDAQNWDVVIANYHLFFSHPPSAFPVPFDALFCDEAHHVAEAARAAATLRVSRQDWERTIEPGAAQLAASVAGRSPEKAEALKEAARKCAGRMRAFFDEGEMVLAEGTLFRKRQDLPASSGAVVLAADDMIQRGRECLGGKNLFGEADALSDAAEQWLEEVQALRDGFNWCAAVDMFPEWAYWWDGKSLLSAPADCSEIVPEWLGSEGERPVVAVSATLALGRDMTYWERETGIRADEKAVFESPFPLAEQMGIWVVDIGLPVTDPGYDERVSRVVERLCDMNGGRTLALLSSRRLLRAVGARLKSVNRSYNVLLQGEAPPGTLGEAFRSDISSVLVGSVSYREGVDVPGEGLTQVIIDRIPFQHPRDPLLRTRKALYGERLFPEIVLPMAKMYLKQAAGRLIRTASDSGRVVILDNRVLSRPDWNIPEALPPVTYRRVQLSGLSVARQ